MKGQRPKRKVVLILVEGQSEINALKPTLSALYDSIDKEIEVFFPTIIEDDLEVRGDITSKIGITPEVIEGCIYKLFLKNFFDKEKLYPKDITEIIQIVDLDGAYIQNCQIVNGENPSGYKKPYYCENQIITNDVSGIIERNERKRNNLNYLSSISQITLKSKKPQYSVFYFSSNLDHFLHNNANLPSRDKALLADAFAEKYGDNPTDFISAIKSTKGAIIDMDYEGSWNYIKEGNHSLEAHTNITLLFDRLMNDQPS